MKSATLPSLRVDPALRRAAEDVLHEGESLSSLIELSLRDQVSRRQFQAEFVARGLASRDEAQRTGKYHDAETVHAELRELLFAAKTRKSGSIKARK